MFCICPFHSCKILGGAGQGNQRGWGRHDVEALGWYIRETGQGLEMFRIVQDLPLRLRRAHFAAFEIVSIVCKKDAALRSVHLHWNQNQPA